MRHRDAMVTAGRTSILCAALLLSSGCVERKLRVESEPSGAEVYLDFRPVGTAPVEVPFTFYGKRRIELRKAGFETLRRDLRLDPPWYEWFPLEVASEVLLPFTLKDERLVRLTMKESASDEAGLRARAEAASKWEWKR